MTYATTMEEFYSKNSTDVKKLLSKYGRSLIYSAKDLRDLAQSFYVMLLDRKAIERFDSTVTNVDKVFTSYICSYIKTYCHEERRREAKDAVRRGKLISTAHHTANSDPQGAQMDIFDCLSYTWSKDGGGGLAVSHDVDHDCLKEGWLEDASDTVSNFRRALETDGDLSDSDREALLSIVDLGNYGDAPGEMSVKMSCRSSRISFFRKRAHERFMWYREAGYV